ncbi:hydrolase [uncultured Proteiniphilum sp.]|uniref:hydrolase n=1 Tax=uncultured Proteiniphilum sp. TaxID=497637 RepID=UPI00261ED8B2|nr:hydrolase [uncultured Proteiniphilum sp.]
MTTQSVNKTICCPEFNPTQWDDKTIEWQNKKFIKHRVFTFFYMPVNFGKVMKKLDKIITEAGAQIPDSLCLSDHTGKWNMNIYLAVDKRIDKIENTTLSGKYFSKVYEGPFKDTGKWCSDYENIVKSKGHEIKKWYMWYTTCPKCAKKYGKNYVVILSQIE